MMFRYNNVPKARLWGMIAQHVNFKFVVVYLFLKLFSFKDYFNPHLHFLCLVMHVCLSSIFPCLHHLPQLHAALRKASSIHQVTTILSTSKNVLFPGHNHHCWWLFTLIITLSGTRATVSLKNVKCHSRPQHRWFSRWMWPANRTFLEVDSIMVTW